MRTGFIGELRQPLLNDVRRLDAQALPLMAERFAHLADSPQAPLQRPLPALQLQVSEAARAAMLSTLGLTLDAPVACLCPGAEYGPAKRWPAEHFGELARLARAAGYQVWLIGSAKDRLIGEDIEHASHGTVRNLCGSTNLEQAIDLLSLAHVVVANDSGLMHIAAALGRPLLALYGSSSPSFTPPLSARARVLKLDLPCSPCFKRECPLGHFECMRKLQPREVFAAFPVPD
jgi:heptosyltransferase-2